MKRLLIALILIISLASLSESAIYYVSPTGNDGNDGSINLPWATFGRATNALLAGDTLLLQDGTYTGQSLAICMAGVGCSASNGAAYPGKRIQGQPGLNITIAAQNPGRAIIDRQWADMALVMNSQYITIDGIIFKNGFQYQGGAVANSYIAWIEGTNITVRRSGFTNSQGCSVSGQCIADLLVKCDANSSAQYCLLEDSYLDGYRGFVDLQGCSYLTARRNVLRGSGAGFDAYYANHNIIENNISVISPATGIATVWNNITKTASSSRSDYNTFIGNISFGNGGAGVATHYAGFGVASNADNNGNYWDSEFGNSFTNNVAINTRWFGGRFDDDYQLTVSNNTVVWDAHNPVIDQGQQYTGLYFMLPSGADRINATVANNSLLGFQSEVNGNGRGIGMVEDGNSRVVLTATTNNSYGFATAYSGKSLTGSNVLNINPAYDTATYYYGAYLFPSANLLTAGSGGTPIGAKVVCQYDVNGAITNVNLWPWPMNQRISDEMGIDITRMIWNNSTFNSSGMCGGVSDTTAPVVTAFTIAATSNSLTVPVTAFTATDNVQVTAYCVTTTNSSAGCSWSSTPQTSVTFASTITPTAYGWAKDAAGNVSTNVISATTITLPVNYTVTPSANPHGSISPSTPQTVGSGATTSFTLTPSVGYSITMGGTCGGSLVSNVFTTSAVTADCSVIGSFSVPAISTGGTFIGGGYFK